ncbi:GNAT family N-acetyltransferase [archaeon]|jgi:L-amino acid N-acyltransferase YncA|nr:GNAT family N-acetyltransferase [archaeon]MBT3451090.1 GNAT family N-acetyltransferase [archaeon]MBT6868666.1 GNAT family N-acetyltransferase [archaeon]MBT7193367.1 GNAT family N-acetyltransferase [archaeon]MBT7381463.1 GNAT family N-acetyltransferase [archaeon]
MIKNICTEIFIRKSKIEDLEEIYEIFLELAKSEDKATKLLDNKLMNLRKRKKEFKQLSKKDILKSIKSRKSICLVAEDTKKEKVIGYCYFTLNKSWCNFFEKPPIIYLNSIVIQNRYRKKGISSLFLKNVKKIGKKEKCRYILLDVISTNPAKKIYQKWGFKSCTETMFKRL